MERTFPQGTEPHHKWPRAGPEHISTQDTATPESVPGILLKDIVCWGDWFDSVYTLFKAFSVYLETNERGNGVLLVEKKAAVILVTSSPGVRVRGGFNCPDHIIRPGEKEHKGRDISGGGV